MLSYFNIVFLFHQSPGQEGRDRSQPVRAGRGVGQAAAARSSKDKDAGRSHRTAQIRGKP